MIKCNVCKTKNKFQLNKFATIGEKVSYICNACAEKFKKDWSKSSSASPLTEHKENL